MNKYEQWWHDYSSWASALYHIDNQEKYELAMNIADTWVMELWRGL